MSEFCETCRRDVEVSIKDKQLTSTFEIAEGPIDVSYIGKIAYCNKCHREVHTHKLNDYNLNKFYKAIKAKIVGNIQ